MNKKYSKLIVIILVIAIFFTSAFAIAKKIQKSSYNSEQIVYENYVSDVLPSMVEEMSTKDDFSTLNSKGNVESVYDEAGIYDKVKDFLGSETDKYWGTLMDIETNCDSYFEGISSDYVQDLSGLSDNPSDWMTRLWSDDVAYSLDMETFPIVYIDSTDNVTEAIFFFGKTKVVYRIIDEVGSNTLLILDHSNCTFLVEPENMHLGDHWFGDKMYFNKNNTNYFKINGFDCYFSYLKNANFDESGAFIW